MRIRAPYISTSIRHAILNPTRSPSLLTLILAFFRIFRLHLTLFSPADFLILRKNTWRISEDDYTASFAPRSAELVPVGDLGYSGSTFFTTPDGKYLVKSLPRRFEHKFFTEELFADYVDHMTAHPESLLVRIMDMPHEKNFSIGGGLLGTAPTHHIVMENLLAGDEDWETFDLKPQDYFFPERDIADGQLASDEVIENLTDRVPHQIKIPQSQHKALLETLRKDTELLKDHAAVDYSLFLARTRSKPSTRGDFRTGVQDVQGEWTYRAVVLDFFWCKSTLQAQAMTGLVDAWNVVAEQGPMSITAEPSEYRERFLRMVAKVIIGDDDGNENEES